MGWLADEPRWLDDLDRPVSLMDGLAVADLADGPVAEADWTPAATPGLITGFLFSGQAWPGSQAALPAPGHGAAAAGRIKAGT